MATTTVETAIYRLQVEGETQIRQMTKAVEGMAVANEDATSSNRRLALQIERGINSYDKVIKAQQTYTKELEWNARARESGASSLKQLEAHLGVITQKYETVTRAAQEAAVATENLRRAQANAAAGPGQAVGGASGAATYAAELDRMMTIAEGKAAQIGRAFGEELDERMIAGTRKAARDSAAAMAAELDKLDRIAQLKAEQAGQNFQRSLNEHFGIDKTQAYRRGAAGAGGSAFGEVETGAQGATKHMDQLGHSTKVARYEMINLGRQAQDVVVSLASGQNILMVGLQQGSQILDVFVSSERTVGEMFKQMGSAIGRFLTNPLTLAVGIVTALVATTLALANAWDKVNVSSQRAISGAGARTGTTVKDLNEFVEKNSPSAFAGTSLSQKESRKLAEDLTQTGDIVISKLRGMSDAVVGFSNQSGKSIDEAIKTFVKMGKDPVKAMDELAGTFGPFEQKTRDLAEAYMVAGDKTSAYNVILDALAKKAKEAAENMGFLEKAGRGVANAAGTLAIKPTGLETDLERKGQELSQAYSSPNKGMGASAQAAEVEKLNKEYEALFARQQAVIDQRMADQHAAVADKARLATEALIPQIEQLREMETKLNAIKAAQAQGDTSPRTEAAGVKAGNEIAALREAEEVSARYQQRVAEISRSWGDVGQSTALALQAAQNNLPVMEAVGGAARMAAQYTADYKNAMDAGKTATEATALAAANLAAAQAQVNAAARETLASLRDQASVAAAITGLEKIKAQSAATYSKLVRDGVSASIAGAVAAQEEANARAAATASVLQQVHALEQSTELIKAQGTGTEHLVKAAQAYENAIRSGASELAASAIYSATIANELARAAAEMGRLSDAAEQRSIDEATARATQEGSYFKPDIMPSGPLTYSGSPFTGGGPGAIDVGQRVTYMLHMQADEESGGLAATVETAYRAGGIQGAMAAIRAAPNSTGVSDADAALYNISGSGRLGHSYDAASILGPERSMISDKISAYDALTQLLNSQTTDRGAQAANIQSEIAWLQTLPASVARDQKINDLMQSIDQLTGSTDSLNATNQELLSPYYTQDPRTSHIGFRSQGMAAGGYVDVPGGYSANDNMLAMVPVASGERIYVDPNTRMRGGAGGQAITINAPVSVYGSNANKDDIGRSVYQNAQAAARQIAMANQ